MMEPVSNDYVSASLKNLMRAYEKELILMALNASGWHQRRAAASLGILPTTLHEKMKRLGLLGRGHMLDVPEAGLEAQP
jgi:DNA-binding NtrC family response regulator